MNTTNKQPAMNRWITARMRKWCAVCTIALLTSHFGSDANAGLVLIRMDATGTLSEGFDPGLGRALTEVDVTLTAPPQSSLSTGDTLEIDLFAPAGDQFVISTPPSATFSLFRFLAQNSSSIACPCSVVAPSQITVVGQTLPGTFTAQADMSFNNNDWFAVTGLSPTGDISFTELSVQFVIPANVSLPIAPLSSLAEGQLLIASDPGAWVGLNPVASVPEPAMLTLLGVGLAGLGFSRRQRKQ